MRSPVYIALCSAIIALLVGSNSCSRYELPVQLDIRGMYIPPSPTTVPQDNFGLTNIHTIDRSIVIDLKYKTHDNITGRPLYHKSMPALLRPNAATRLAYANQLLKEQGFKIKVWDAYRPHHAQIAIWEAAGRDERYVANPYTKPVLHSRGVAVDVTLVHLNGKEAKMPTKFDEFKPHAATYFYHTDPVVRKNLKTLKDAMYKAGFQDIATEWWHFVDHEWENYEMIKDIY